MKIDRHHLDKCGATENNRMIKTASVIIALFLLTGISRDVNCSERQECAVCGMYIDLYERTRHVVHFNDRSPETTCSLACAAILIEKYKGKIICVEAADFLTGKLIAADTANYLEGSDIPGVMSYTSRIAFSSKKKALSFRKKHGGRILSFEEALKRQLMEKK